MTDISITQSSLEIPSRAINLLSLDGGGVRGLSSLAIVQQIMISVNPDNPPLPCDYFDMIGGTSTGGLIAIMLGRLRMTVEACMNAYVTMSDKIFQKKRARLNLRAQVQARFDGEEIEICVKEVLRSLDMDPDTLLRDDSVGKCKVFVCATSQETSDTVLLTSFRTSRTRDHLFRTCTIWEACRATSAATSFFDPISIGPYSETFIDGALTANNPVNEIWSLAKDTWKGLEAALGCLVSIGTGIPSLVPFGKELKEVADALIHLAVETERTAELFVRDKSSLDDTGRYYRFNVIRGLEKIGLEDASQQNAIIAATGRYLESQAVQKQLRASVEALGRKFGATAQVTTPSREDLIKAVDTDDSLFLHRLQRCASVAQIKDENGSNLLHRAAEKSDAKTLFALLTISKINVNEKNNDGWTAMHYAVRRGDLGMLGVLLQKRADPEAKTNLGRDMCHIAAECGQVKILQHLQYRRCDLNSVDFKRNTPFHLACANNQARVVSYAIKAGLNQYVKNANGKTGKDLANELENRLTYKLLCAQRHIKVLLHVAAETDDEELLTFGLEENLKPDVPNTDGKTPLHIAANRGYLSLCQKLLSIGADPFIETPPNGRYTPLDMACAGGHLDTVSLLLDCYLQLDSHDSVTFAQPLCIASKNGHTDIVSLLLSHNAPLDSPGSTGLKPIDFAAKNGHDSVVTLLLERGAQPPAPSSQVTVEVEAPSTTSQDRDIARIMVLGFSADQAREALANTGSGTNCDAVPAAASWLLRSGYKRGRANPSREAIDKAIAESTPHEMLSRDRDTLLRQKEQASRKDHPLPEGGKDASGGAPSTPSLAVQQTQPSVEQPRSEPHKSRRGLFGRRFSKN